jgi:hypothetical protein
VSKHMNLPHCEHEQQVIEAWRFGRWAGPWGEEIRRHAADCAVCSEVARVAEALRREDERQQREVRLPSAGLVWWKAQLAARRAAEERAAQPIAWVERMAQVFGTLALLGLGWWQWPRILAWWSGSNGPRGLGGTPAGSAEWVRELLGTLGPVLGQWPGYLLLVSVGAFLMLLASAAYLVWREE